jgi:nucleolar GTP-binding protein
MNFQNLQKVQSYDYYMDAAFKHARSKIIKLNLRKTRSRDEKLMLISINKIKSFSDRLRKQLAFITEAFPHIDELPEFYSELSRLILDVDQLKKSLYAVSWAEKKIQQLTKTYVRKIKRTKDHTEEKNYYGRIGSIMKHLQPQLDVIEKSRFSMRQFPTVKTGIFTVAIAGFPNVGKSTLLSKLTTAKPEIKDYAFTTKQLNFGYAAYGTKKIQFIDIPGTLNRFEKMNLIEKQGFLVIKLVADVIIYVYDPTESWSLQDQEALFHNLEVYDKPILVYVSKTDICKTTIKPDAARSPDELNNRLRPYLEKFSA